MRNSLLPPHDLSLGLLLHSLFSYTHSTSTYVIITHFAPYPRILYISICILFSEYSTAELIRVPRPTTSERGVQIDLKCTITDSKRSAATATLSEKKLKSKTTASNGYDVFSPSFAI